jgi:RNA polymerase sigma-70 factor (ECF subfamily)
MKDYDGSRAPSLAEARTRAREALWNFTSALVAGDLPRMESLLAEECRAASDGGGEFYAALNVLEGAGDVARFYHGIFTKFGGMPDAAPIEVGGMPGLLIDMEARGGDRYRVDLSRVARRFVILADVDREGRISRLYSVLASRKLTHVAAR